MVDSMLLAAVCCLLAAVYRLQDVVAGKAGAMKAAAVQQLCRRWLNANLLEPTCLQTSAVFARVARGLLVCAVTRLVRLWAGLAAFRSPGVSSMLLHCALL